MFKPANARLGNQGGKKWQPRAERVAMAKSATLSLDGADLNMPCTVRDLSDRGARISVSNIAGIPDEFVLIIRSENLVARVRVEWRRHVELGMLFLRKGELFEEEKFRAMQSKVYKAEQARLQDIARQEMRLKDEKRAVVEKENQQVVEERIRTVKLIGLDHRRPFTAEDLKRAYRQQAMTKHPDHGGTMEEFMELNNAYRTLVAHLRDSQSSAKKIAI